MDIKQIGWVSEVCVCVCVWQEEEDFTGCANISFSNKTAFHHVNYCNITVREHSSVH